MATIGNAIHGIKREIRVFQAEFGNGIDEAAPLEPFDKKAVHECPWLTDGTTDIDPTPNVFLPNDGENYSTSQVHKENNLDDSDDLSDSIMPRNLHRSFTFRTDSSGPGNNNGKTSLETSVGLSRRLDVGMDNLPIKQGTTGKLYGFKGF